ncbi:hypothetical protein PMZ80_009714 [Knufia obscura]|uniref:Uncharacterized protein n=1 Tax=Knufia obscura TaxID=1635080 RepID=A0ABR0RBZ7_9EURO|nr:hypothetical protein PMZ80_009714 [Knufia obscura]
MPSFKADPHAKVRAIFYRRLAGAMIDDWQTWLLIPLDKEETILDIADGQSTYTISHSYPSDYLAITFHTPANNSPSPGHTHHPTLLNPMITNLIRTPSSARTIHRLLKYLKTEHIRQREVLVKLSGRCGRRNSTSECGRSMAVMERLFERDQRHREELDGLIRLVAAFEDCERQVGEVICEFGGEEGGGW